MRWLAGIALILLVPQLAAANLIASVDRNRIAGNATIELTLIYDGRVDSDAIDFGGLTADFDLLGQVQPQTSYQSINGQESYLTSWTLVLTPKRSGTLVIPSFTVNGTASAPIRIEVTDTAASGGDEPLLVAVEASPRAVIENEQILVTVRLRVGDGVGNVSGSRLEIPGIDVRLVDERRDTRLDNGIAYQVAEWRYSVFPATAGDLVIPTQIFSGIGPGSRRRLFDPFGTGGTRLIARSEPITIPVTAKPEPADPWLPASAVTISASWGEPLTEVRAGEPITRTIEISARGQVATRIPPLPEIELPAYKQYRDQPQIEDLTTAEGITGRRRESVAIVPLTEGRLVLPEVRIRWWHTGRDEWQEAVLPGETLTVAPAVRPDSAAPSNPEPAVPGADQGDAPGEAAKPDPASVGLAAPGGLSRWQWSTVVLSVCCAVLLVLWLRERRPAAAPVKTDAADAGEAREWAALQHALKTGEAAAIRQTILAWSRSRWPGREIRGLDAVINHGASDALAMELRKLDRVLYGATREPYQADGLGAALRSFRHSDRGEAATQSTALAVLYPGPVYRD